MVPSILHKGPMGKTPHRLEWSRQTREKRKTTDTQSSLRGLNLYCLDCEIITTSNTPAPSYKAACRTDHTEGTDSVQILDMAAPVMATPREVMQRRAMAKAMAVHRMPPHHLKIQPMDPSMVHMEERKAIR